MKKVLVLISSLGIISCGGGEDSGSPNVTCSSFRYQEDAQENYSKKLDSDADGIACESLPKRPSGSQTTNQNQNADAQDDILPYGKIFGEFDVSGEIKGMIKQENGEYFFFYTDKSGKYLDGVVHGNMKAKGRSFYSENGIDYNKTMYTANNVKINGKYIADIIRHSINGSIEYSSSMKTYFDATIGTIESEYRYSRLEGVFSGYFYIPKSSSGNGELSVSIKEDMSNNIFTLAYKSNNGGSCTAIGYIDKYNRLDFWNTELSFTGLNCPIENQKLNGIIIVNKGYQADSIYLAVFSPQDVYKGFIFEGNRVK